MNFNVEEQTNKIINFIRDYYQTNNLDGAVIGISGGKDSAVVSALFTKALGKENVVGLTLPCHSNSLDREDAKKISDYYGFKLYNLDLTHVFDAFIMETEKIDNFSLDERKNSDINLKPRLRMASLYYMAALLSAKTGKTYLVAGTSNKCELYVGYFTKGGDSVHDIGILNDLTVDEVIKIGEYLKVPSDVLYKKPSDGLSNMSDEDKLGVKYSEIAAYIENPDNVDEEVCNKIKKLHKANEHKFNIPTYRK